jgi:hypothetical protein
VAETREARRARYLRLRARIFEMYGGACQCCGEDRSPFLTLDHIDGGGHRHRRQKGGPERSYKDALAEYRPDLYQVLCANCNQATSYGRECPHVKTGVPRGFSYIGRPAGL